MSGIQRDSEATQLRRVIYNSDLSEGEPSRPKVSICDLSGTGGVGKTFLASYVLDSEELAKRAYCTLKLDGQAANLRADFMGLVEQRLCSKSIATPAQPEKDYFPRLRNLADDYTAMLEQVEIEFRQKSSPNKEIETIKPELASRQALLLSLLKAGYLINKVVPVTQKYLNFSELPMKKDDAEAAIQFLCAEARDLEALKSPTPGILRRRFNRVFGVPGKYRMRRQLHDLTAEYIMSDLRKVIAGLTSKRREQLVGKRKFEFERLLIVIDDFEVIGPVLAPFLFGSLLPLLRNADFETVLLIIGRDELESAHPEWSDSYSDFVQEKIRLQLFNQGQALEFLAANGVSGSEADRFYAFSEGYPFLLNLLVETRGQVEDGKLPIDLSRRVFDRTTKWMSETQKAWFSTVVYLETINIATLRWFFGPEDVANIQAWFERDPAIRDPRASVYRVRADIRTNVLRYLEARDPDGHKEKFAKIKEGLQKASS